MMTLGLGEIREKVKGQQFTRGVENTNRTDCIFRLIQIIPLVNCLSSSRKLLIIIHYPVLIFIPF
jgi:hypothetical protein